MNILYIDHYAGSKSLGMEFRPYYLGMIWKEMGHNVTIVGSSFSHLRACQPVVNGRFSAGKLDGLDYLWIKGAKYYGNGFGRLLNVAQFLFGLFLYQRKILEKARPDVVIASSTYPMDIWPAKYIANGCNARLIFELHDVWPQSLTEIAGLSRFNPFVVLAGMAERTVYSSADGVVSMLPAIHEHCARLAFDVSKLTIVPNGIVIDDWYENDTVLPQKILTVISEFREKGHFIVCYTGAHGLPNDLENLINAAELLKNEAIGFLLVGDGHLKAELEKLVVVKGLNNVSMCESIPKLAIPKLLGLVDVGFIAAKNKPIYKHGISPNKIADYMMAGIPVISAIEAGNDPVEDASCGYSVAPGNAQALAASILRMDSIGQSERKKMGQRGKEYVLKNYNYQFLAEKFMEAMK